MDRRSFLRGALTVDAGVVATPALLELLQPTRRIFLPPRGGWSNRLTSATDLTEASLLEVMELIRQLIRQDMERVSGLPSYFLSTPRDVVYYRAPFPHNYGIKRL